MTKRLKRLIRLRLARRQVGLVADLNFEDRRELRGRIDKVGRHDESPVPRFTVRCIEDQWGPFR